MIESPILLPLLAGIGMALFSGVIGSFVVWRRMSYLGDSLAHSALLGIALGLVLPLSDNIGIMIVCVIFAFLLLWLQNLRVLTTDTLLGILAHAGLSIGMVAISLLGEDEIEVHDYLLADILQVSLDQVYWLYIGGVILLILLLFNWSSLLLMTISEDLAKAENVNVFLMRILIVFLMTIVVSVSVEIIGILLITSLLIIPAASARQLARSPESMAILSCFLGVIAVLMGLYGAIEYGTPSGASIVASSSLIFALLLPLASFYRLLRKKFS